MTFTSYLPALPLRNGHINTIFSAAKRVASKLPYERERLTTPDDDFLDLDWLRFNHKRVAVLLHGLEASSQSTYVLGMARTLSENGWDIAAMNYRSCSGEMNRQARVYHSGATDDVGLVMDRVCLTYEEVVIVSFSLGANLALKYAGEQGSNLSLKIKAVAAISVPLDLEGSSKRISYDRKSVFYQEMFLRSLRQKVRLKQQDFPSIFTAEKLAKVKRLYDFDEIFTGPLHGFAGASDYYQKCTALRVLDDIQVPSLLIIAQDDPFLANKNWAGQLGKNSSLQLLEPAYGGHVGFSYLTRRGNWMEQQVLYFLLNHVQD